MAEDIILKIATVFEKEGSAAGLKFVEDLKVQATAAGQAGSTSGQQIVASYDRVAQAFAQASSSGQGFMRSALAGFQGIPPAAAAGIAAVGGVALAYKAAAAAVESFATKQEVVTRLDAVLAGQGQLTDAYREKLQALANQMQETFSIGNETFLDVFAKLTQFGADTTNIEKYTQAVINLSGVTGAELTQSSTMFARAMQGNFDMFSRYGLVVEEAGTQTERLNNLMEMLAERGAGILEARAKTTSGQIDGMKQAIDDLQGGIGQLLVSTGAIGMWTDAIKGAANALTDLTGGNIIGQVNGLGRNILTVAENAKEAASTLATLPAVDLKAVADRAAEIAKSYEQADAAAQRLRQAQAALSGSQMQSELADIDALVASGEMDASTAALMKGQVQRRYQDKALRDERGALEGQRGRLETDRDASGRLAAGGESAAAAAKAAFEAAAQALLRDQNTADANIITSAEARRGSVAGARGRMPREMAAAQDAVEEASRTDGNGNYLDPAALDAALNRLDALATFGDRLTDLETKAADYVRLQEAANVAIGKYATTQAAAEQAIAELEPKIKAVNTQLETLNKQQQTAVDAYRKETEAKAQEEERQARVKQVAQQMEAETDPAKLKALAEQKAALEIAGLGNLTPKARDMEMANITGAAQSDLDKRLQALAVAKQSGIVKDENDEADQAATAADNFKPGGSKRDRERANRLTATKNIEAAEARQAEAQLQAARSEVASAIAAILGITQGLRLDMNEVKRQAAQQIQREKTGRATE